MKVLIQERIIEEMTNYNPTPEEYAAIYARKSTKLENNSLHSQASLARDEIKKRNLFLYDIYEDEESATKFHPMHRPGFKRLLYDAIEGRFKTVVVFRRDRLARKVEDLIEIKNFFKKHGIKIIYSNQGEYQTDDNSYISSFIENIIMSVDELEPGILAERIAAGKEQKRKRGEYSGAPPFGYVDINTDKNDRYKKKFMPHEITGPIVKAVFETFLKEVDSYSQFERFIKKVKQFPQLKKKSAKGIKDILLRPIYGGLILKQAKTDPLKTVAINSQGNLEVGRDMYIDCITVVTPIIETDIWYECLKKYKSIIPPEDKIENEDLDYLFKGLLYCSKCYKPIYQSNDEYKCLKGCTHISVSILQDLLLTKILEDLLKKDAIKIYQQKQIDDLTNYIKMVEKKIGDKKRNEENELRSLITNYSSTKKPDYTSINELIKQEKELLESIESRKERSVRAKIALEQLSKIAEIDNKIVLISMFKRSFEISQELFTAIISKIYVNTEKVNLNDHGGFDIRYKR